MDLTVIKRFPDWSSENFNLEQYFNIYQTSNVVVHAVSNDIYYPAHKTTLTVKYAVKGDEYYITNKCKYRVDNENFLVINDGQEYESYISSDEKVESIAVFFNPDFTAAILNSILSEPGDLLDNFEEEIINENQVNFFERLYPRDSSIIPRLLNIRNSTVNGLDNRAYVLEQLAFILESLFFLNRNQFDVIERLRFLRKSTRIEIYKRLNRVKDYILSCYNQNISLSELAGIACMNRYYLLREFKKFFNLTPYQYLTSVRLKEAKKLLMNSSKSISEISLLVGFEFPSSLDKLFSSRCKISPRKFRSAQTHKKSILDNLTEP